MQPVEEKRRFGIHGYVRSIAPELVAGASDNDPTNVGTAIAVGAATVYRLAWVAILVAPLLGTVEDCGRGWDGRRQRHPIVGPASLRRFVSAVLLASIVPVNIVTIAADLLAGAAGFGKLTGFRSRWWVVPLGLVVVVPADGGLLRTCSCGWSRDPSCWVSSRLEYTALSRAAAVERSRRWSFVPRLPLHPRGGGRPGTAWNNPHESYVSAYGKRSNAAWKRSLSRAIGRIDISRAGRRSLWEPDFTALVAMVHPHRFRGNNRARSDQQRLDPHCGRESWIEARLRLTCSQLDSSSQRWLHSPCYLPLRGLRRVRPLWLAEGGLSDSQEFSTLLGVVLVR